MEISKEEYDNLVDSDLKLTALETTGVDNWSGYPDAIELYEEWKKNN